MRYEHSDNYLFTDDYHLEHYAAGSAKKGALYKERVAKPGGGWSYIYETAKDAGGKIGGELGEMASNSIQQTRNFVNKERDLYNTKGAKRYLQYTKGRLKAVARDTRWKAGKAAEAGLHSLASYARANAPGVQKRLSKSADELKAKGKSIVDNALSYIPGTKQNKHKNFQERLADVRRRAKLNQYKKKKNSNSGINQANRADRI